MATAYLWSNRADVAAAHRTELRRAQASQPIGDGLGISAASHTGVTTGIDNFLLFQRLHVGATSWNVFAQLAFNPYYQSVAAPACVTNVSAANHAVSSSATSITISVHAGAGCAWTAASNAAWLATPAANGSGYGEVTVNVSANAGSAARSGTLTIAGRTVTVSQGAVFADVPTTALFHNEIGKISALGITLGCSAGNFCPSQVVTREQMAAFIIRALGMSNPPANLPQRFADVPASNQFYGFIDELSRRGVTTGCSATAFCPQDPVTREQMAAFLIRAVGPRDAYANVPQRFGDVAPGSFFYAFIDQLALREVTQGCSPGQYCPSEPVTREQMAAFLVRAFGL
jgi:hypothetical protein